MVRVLDAAVVGTGAGSRTGISGGRSRADRGRSFVPRRRLRVMDTPVQGE